MQCYVSFRCTIFKCTSSFLFTALWSLALNKSKFLSPLLVPWVSKRSSSQCSWVDELINRRERGSLSRENLVSPAGRAGLKAVR